MTQPLTDLQDQRQNETVTTQWQGAAPTALQDNGGTVPNVYAQMDLTKQAANPINPPSTAEIHKQMWIGSFMMALMSGLASGNPAAAIVGGMWGAIGIHDYGNTLQQRAKQVPQLQKDGYSMQAILKWYEDGDNSELDKERDYKLRAQEHADTVQHQKDEMQQQKTFHDDQMAQERENRAAADARFYAGQRFADARAERALQNANTNQDRADARLEKQSQTQLDSELRKTIEGPKAKQYYMQMAEKAMSDLQNYRDAGNTAGMAEAYHNVRNNLARASLGGNATLNDHDIEGATGLPQWSSSKANELGILANGKPSDEWMNATTSQIHDDIKNERATITQQGQQAYDSLIASDVPPEVANARVNKAMIGTGIMPRDWSKQDQPAEPEKPSQSDVDDVMKKYGHSAK
ncbi:hypothetical protein [Citrobacter freundii]|uniref:hypothetical protein n=1 Tax=Citrobacter freundii TaxID=546 RepID=UPI001865C836|nr:hypothetical protein [Citrobacter freundii]